MFEPPASYALLLLLALPVLALWQHSQRRRRAVPLNVSYQLGTLSWTWRRSTLWVVPLLRLLGMAALIIAAAKPFDWRAAELTDSEGIAIAMVVDRSGSMRRDDILLEGRRVSRLSAVVDAANRFIIGDRGSGSRSHDLIGLVRFAGDAETVCPLTLDHEQVVASLEQMRPAADYRRDGTAIGDGVALAVAELQSLDRSLHLRDPTAELTRIIVLLTDGQQNAGELTPGEAARLAQHYGIRVYAIGLAESESSGQTDPLRSLAERTGGTYFRVSETRSLRAIYDSIDALERTQLTQRRLATRRQWAVEWFRLGPWELPPLAWIGLVALAAETILRRTIYLPAVGDL
ncbi:VWA domain-containing protein [Candidatus Laterigemmans baculatus]|uniref:VWA domain-containing protein n=1 Tax=Candidatus Laterigemmans baculatus TaxID=2770505 RepID=UPI0013DB89A6|nr:VWA domain-containing protein [Candidatus Laterigemmans baculatus]